MQRFGGANVMLGSICPAGAPGRSKPKHEGGQSGKEWESRDGFRARVNGLVKEASTANTAAARPRTTGPMGSGGRSRRYVAASEGQNHSGSCPRVSGSR